ncbi:MAG: homoserine dehydrogenase [Oscillospiraceae bacterium]|nr:homoserine dehydrogenase [Oscillospiraceae bacterium]
MAYAAILGYGTVGSGVAKVLTDNGAEIEKASGEAIKLKYIVDVRSFPDDPNSDKLISDFSVVENDADVGIVAETIGGVGVAYEFTKRALLAGKSVVTSNKELVAAHGRELLSIAAEKNVSYLFEASVGGGIPLLRPLTQCLGANRIEEIKGIVNGTTNYILTCMEKGGVSFDEALATAQRLGYAERDPSADIDGKDACRKICILADLAFGKEFIPEQVRTVGIRNVDAEDIKICAGFGARIKLIARTGRTDGGEYIFVEPHVVMPSCMLNGVSDSFNAIIVRGNAVGECMFYGRGAGSIPTASAVVGDMIEAVLHREKRRGIGWDADSSCRASDGAGLVSRWYVRTGARWELLEPCTAADTGDWDIKYRILD